MSEWLRLDFDKFSESKERGQKVEALRQIGTNGLPTLLRLLRKKDSRSMARLRSFIERSLPSRVPVLSAQEMRVRAAITFEFLAPESRIAVPELTRMLDDYPWSRAEIALALGGIGPDASPAIRSLLRHTHDPDEVVRRNMLTALARIQFDPDTVIPVLIQCLNDPSPRCRGMAATALGEYKERAKAAVPALVNSLTNQDSYVRTRIQMACKAIDPAAAAAAGVK